MLPHQACLVLLCGRIFAHLPSFENWIRPVTVAPSAAVPRWTANSRSYCFATIPQTRIAELGVLSPQDEKTPSSPQPLLPNLRRRAHRHLTHERLRRPLLTQLDAVVARARHSTPHRSIRRNLPPLAVRVLEKQDPIRSLRPHDCPRAVAITASNGFFVAPTLSQHELLPRRE